VEGDACHFCGVPAETSGLGGVLQRRYELDSLKRSMAMLSPGQHALSREEAMKLLGELSDVQERLDRLRAGLRQLLEEDGSGT
jgi:hypothetical protein